MRVLVQRVMSASVTVDGATVGAIDRGLLLFVAIADGDNSGDVEPMTSKIVELRLFGDDEGRMSRSARDLVAAGESCELLVVSQFTLYGDVRKGRRPSFVRAAPPDIARTMIDHLAVRLRAEGFTVAEGVFGAKMAVSLVNDGPVTIWIDSDELRGPRRSAGLAGDST